MFNLSSEDITLREVLFSIGIVLVCIAGLIAGNFAILNHYVGINEKYELAREIDTPEMFQYYHNTNIGDAFTYAELEYVDPVSVEEITGNYSYIYRIEERYTEHEDMDGDTYYTWDRTSHLLKTSKKVNFNGIEIDANLINTNSAQYKVNPSKLFSHIDSLNGQPISRVDNDYIYTDCGFFSFKDPLSFFSDAEKARYSYYVVDLNLTGAAFVSLSDNTIKSAEGSNSIIFRNNRTVEEAKEDSLESPVIWLVLLWGGGLLLTAFLVVGFYICENNWLNN